MGMTMRMLTAFSLLFITSLLIPFNAVGAQQAGELVVNEPTEVFADDGEVVWQGAPGEIYRVLSVDADWALVAVGAEADAILGWVQLDGRVALRPSEVAAPAPAPASAPAPQPTATPIPPSGPGTVLRSDDFSDPGRATLPRTSVNQNHAAGYVDGEYEIRSGRSDNTVAFVSVSAPGYQNMSVAADVRVFGGPQSRGASLACRNSNLGDYRAHFRVEQQMVFIQREGQALVQVPAPALRRGDAVNRIELWCVGTTITVMANGVTVATTEDATLPGPGSVQLGVQGSGSTARFDNLVITQR
jgi:hypothetical protein